MTSTTAFPLADPDLADRLTARLALVEERLRDAVTNVDPLADDASRHLVNAGGKRLRPLLTLLAAELGRRRPGVRSSTPRSSSSSRTWRRCTTTTSWTRRRCGAGRPAAHEVWGNSVAILTGDLLFARASATVAGLGPDAVRIQAATFERLCLGQLHETVGPRPEDDRVEHYLQVLADKTASLIATSARFGAMFAGCRPDVVATVTEFGEKIGVAFQLADDVIDLTSDGDVTGKTPGTDLREQVPTMPALLLRARAAGPDGTRRGPPTGGGARRGPVGRRRPGCGRRGAAGAPGGRGDARSVRSRWRRPRCASSDPLPAGPVKDALVSFADALVDRAS